MVSRSFSGLNIWLVQRISSVYIVLYLLSITIYTSINNTHTSFTSWHEFFSYPVVYVSSMLFILSLLSHAWIGGRDIIIDYIHPFYLRLTILILFGLFNIVCGIWAVYILIPVSA